MIINASIPNNAPWRTTFQFTDASTGDLLDFTDCYIEITIREECRRCIEVSTDDSTVSIVGLGTFEIDVDLGRICPGSYAMGGLFSTAAEPDTAISLFTGTLSIYDGVARR